MPKTHKDRTGKVQDMPKQGFIIRSNGTIDIDAGGITLSGICPYINEKPILPFLISAEDNSVRYETEEGNITVTVRSSEDEVILSTEIEGFEAVRDIDPLGCAVLDGADRVYYQGFGMEGPSGFRKIDSEPARSHGLIGLAGADTSVALFAADHRSYNTQFSVREHQGMYSAERILSAGIDLECTHKAEDGVLQLPDIHIIYGDDTISCMRRAAEKIAAEMGARNRLEPAYHWCSWYYHYENMSQEILDGFLQGLEKERFDFRYIQLDAGYTSHIGDWLKPNHRYPEGLGTAAASIIDAGFKAGIWIAPFMVGDQSDLYREHPDWVLHERDGAPFVRFRSYTEPKIWGNTDNDYYVLDVTHPDAFAYLKDVFTQLRDWGFTLYKLDFLLWGMADSSKVVRYDGSKTSVMAIRDMLAMIRNVTGEDSYLLGSIAPFMPCMGYADGMRIASDMGAQWTAGAFGPANLLQELPYDNYFNNLFWQNDPDSVILRDFATHLSEEETFSIALLQALSGGIITTSDPVERLTDKRKELLKFIRPAGRVSAQMPYLEDDREEIVITHQLHDWDLLYVLNPTDHPLKVDIRTDELFGSKALFQYRFDRYDDGIAAEKSSCFSDILASHESALLFITEEPLTARPSNLWGRTTS